MATLSDVAKHAGVSTMTVSRYVNESGYVSKETADRIEKAIAATGYHPNAIARSLVTKKTNTLGLVIASIADPFYPKLVLGAEDAAYECGTSIILCNVEGKAELEFFINLLISKCVDGIIFAYLNLTDEHVKLLHANGIPFSMIDNQSENQSGMNVRSNDYLGAKAATEYLIQKGHKRIALMRGPLEDDVFDHEPGFEETYQFPLWQGRTDGFMDAIQCAGIDMPSEYIQYARGLSTENVEGGRRAMLKLMTLSQPPTAIFCENDLMAIGAYKAAGEIGIKIPEDVSIMGYDGLDFSGYLNPELSTMDLPKYEMGRAAVFQLIRSDCEKDIEFKAKLHEACSVLDVNKIAQLQNTEKNRLYK